MKRIELFVDGERAAPAGRTWFPDIDPATGQPHAEVCEATSDDVDRAVQAAKRAAGPWGRLAASQRADVLDRVAAQCAVRAQDLLAAEVKDTGKPVTLARTVDVPRAAANFKAFAAMARTLGTEMYETATDDGEGALNYGVRTPLGVVGVICPWNLPLLLMTWKVAPALAAGNAVVVKPSEETPATATVLGEIMKEAGVPDGLYNVVHGFGPGSAGEHLVKHPDVAAITFTGESRTGASIMAAAAPQVKRLSFELGGKNAAIVFADCDFDKAVAGTLRSTFMNTGQVCLCSERVYVHRSIFDRFVAALAAGARALTLGDPNAESTTTGPLISHEHAQKVLSYYELARAEGATTIIGGGVPDLPAPFASGSWVQPTIWTGLKESARAVREEVFGPCCHVAPFDDEEEAVRMANDTPYGLCAAIWTQDVSRAHRVAKQMDVGLVWVNTWYLRDLRTAFGGTKLSGVGREGGRHSFEFYAETKNVCVKL